MGIGGGRDGLNPYIVVPALVVVFAAVSLESSSKTNKSSIKVVGLFWV